MSSRILTRLDDSKMSPRVEKILKVLNENVVGQEHAVRQIPDALEIAFSPFREDRRPMGTFFFLGPSGTGKTETAEQLAKCLLGSPDALTKIEGETMSQEHQIAALIGSPPGYVGFQDPDDASSEHPQFSDWNLYKHHFECLQRENRGLMEEVDKMELEMANLAEKRADFARRYRDIWKFNQDYTDQKQIIREEFEKLWSDPDLKDKPKDVVRLQELRKLASLLAQKAKRFQTEGPILYKELIALTGPLQELRDKYEILMAECKAKGLDWEPGKPVPKNLMAIVLFDELEKAHFALHHLLYQILDKGRIKNSNGVEVNFEQCIIIATGNVASIEIADALHGSSMVFKQHRQKTKEELGEEIYEIALERTKEDLPPPLLGRFDSIEVFRPLFKEDMEKIFDIQVRLLADDLAKKGVKVSIDIDPEVKDYLVTRSMKHMEWGARLLKQRVRKYVRLKVVRLVITEQVHTGDTICIGLENGHKMFFSKADDKTVA